MPISPKQAAYEGKHTLLSTKLKAMEQMIDQKLKVEFDGVNPVRYNLLDGAVDLWIQRQIEQHYAAAGWTVKFDGYDDQRDGCSYWIVFTPKEVTP